MRAATGDGDAVGEDAIVGAAVAVALGAVLPAACGDCDGEGAALPALGDVGPPERDGAPHAARTTRPTRDRAAKRVTR